MVDIKINKDKEFKQETVKVDVQREQETSRTTNTVTKNLNDYNALIRTSKNVELKGSARLKLSNLSEDPATCQVGEFVLVGGVLKVCTATDTFTVVGTQT